MKVINMDRSLPSNSE